MKDPRPNPVDVLLYVGAAAVIAVTIFLSALKVR